MFGSAAFLLALFCVGAGVYRKEIILILCGGGLALMVVYAFLALIIQKLICRGGKEGADAAILTYDGFCVYAHLPLRHEPTVIHLPGVLIRYEINLLTRDQRRLRHLFLRNFWYTGIEEIPPPGRGAYYADEDFWLFADIFGFFYTRRKIKRAESAPLLITLPPPDKTRAPWATPNALAQRSETVRGDLLPGRDSLVEQRPYIPGDDPRRINWKLYGHSDSLFVREDEREKPPNVEIMVYCDTTIDAAFLKGKKVAVAQEAADQVCEAALAFIVPSITRGARVKVGFPGAEDFTLVRTVKEARDLLAYPYAAAPGAKNMHKAGVRISIAFNAHKKIKVEVEPPHAI
jgi:hypothetical protein